VTVDSIGQPAYLPWLGYRHRVAISDVHVMLDHVQFECNSFCNRNKVRSKTGLVLLTVPVATGRHGRETAICDLEVVNDGYWGRKHFETIRLNYVNAPCLSKHQDFLAETVRDRRYRRLVEVLSATTNYLLEQFSIATPRQHSSSMKLSTHKGGLILEICRQLGASTYLSGPFGRDYLDLTAFRQAGTAVEFHDYRHPVNEQAYPGFISHLSVLDLILNHGPDSRAILMGERA
jgi:WbqC-like protein family